MSSSPVPLKTRRLGMRCTLNLSRAQPSSRWCGVVVKLSNARRALYLPLNFEPLSSDENDTPELASNSSSRLSVTFRLDKIHVHQPLYVESLQ
ncbi:hypothetical protein TNCV_1709821 [Trichonephila clavipes]|nr:hypothetical protein TNCV_1709821 [Trichonephila clavipes]